MHFARLSPVSHSIPSAVIHHHFHLIVLDLLHCQGHYQQIPLLWERVAGRLVAQGKKQLFDF